MKTPKKSVPTGGTAKRAGAPLRRARRTEPAPALSMGSAKEGDIEQQIFQTIFQSVLDQRLTPGTKLPEPALCELFGVNRAVVRKVLQRLEHDHVVELRPNRGAIIAAPSPDETREIFEARRALEAAIVELAAHRHSPADLAALEGLLRHEHALSNETHQHNWAACAREFHLKIAAIAGNPILTAYLNELMSRCSLIVALYQPIGNAACEHAEHRKIVEYMAKRDVASARAEMGAHLRRLEDSIRLDRPSSARTLAQMLNLG